MTFLLCQEVLSFLKFCGLIHDGKKWKVILFVFKMLLLQVVMTPIYISMYNTCKIKGIGTDFFQGFALFVVLLAFFVLISVVAMNHEKFIDVYNCLVDFEIFGKPPKQDEISKNFNPSFVFTKYALIFCTMVYALYTYFVRGSLCKKHNIKNGLNETCGTFLMKVEMAFVDLGRFPYKEIVSFVQLVCSLYVFVLAVAVCTVSIQFSQLIIARLQHLQKLLSECFDAEYDYEKQRRLIHCVEYHYHIIEIFFKYQSAFKILGLLHVFMIIVIPAVESQLVRDGHMGALYSLISFSALTFHQCANGSTIIEESLKVSEAAYNSKWYEADAELRRYTILIMIRAQKPLQLHFGPFGVLSLPLVLTIWKTSYSYLMLLNHVI